MEKAWGFIWDNFFSEKTNLFYDYIVPDYNGDKLVGHLPSTDEISRQIPNACGWGTGMEDSVLSAGTMIDAVIARYNVTKDDNMKLLSDKLFNGMMRCVVDLDDGFISRSVSPIDGKSFYYDTSRDQYTHWVYGALRLYKSSLADSVQRENIKNVIISIGKRMERNVRPENDYNFLRYDCETSIAGKMWGELGSHEYMRLPFFYVCAWYVSGDKHWFDLYMKYRDVAFQKQSDFNPKSYGLRCYPVLQMQYSLRAIYEIDPDPYFKTKCLEFMTKVKEYYNEFVISESQRICAEINEEKQYYYQYKSWNKVRMLYQGIIGNRPYFNPAQSEMSENRGFYYIRNIGEAVSILALCPNSKISQEHLDALENLSDAIDYDRICNYSPMLLACGWWLAKEANM